MQSIYNLDMTQPEIAVLDYLEYNKIFFEPQAELAKRIGFSREHTNIAIQGLRRKGLIVVLKSKNLNQKLRLIGLSGNCVEAAR